MTETRRPVHVGYYTVVQCDRTGWTGGVLVLNELGRPLEFRCTLPVRPSRAHEILYGPTLREYLIGDLIGPTLVRGCRTPMSMLCCQHAEALAMDSVVDVPICLVSEAAEEDEGPVTPDMLSDATQVRLGAATLLVALERADEVQSFCDALQNLPDAVEPFERIREAIREAHSQLARAA